MFSRGAPPNIASVNRLRAGLLIGLVVTLAVAVAAAAGLLMPLERITLDWRFRQFTHFRHPPSTHVLHIDVDDSSLAALGRWPWHRDRMADVVNELNRAGAAVIAFDVLFAEPQDPRWVPEAPSLRAAPVPAGRIPDPPTFREVDDDALLTRAISRSVPVLLPVSLDPVVTPDPLLARALDTLAASPADSLEQITAPLHLTAQQLRHVQDHFASLRIAAIRRRLRARVDPAGHLPSLSSCIASIFPAKVDPGSEAVRVLREEHARLTSLLELERPLPPADVAPAGLPRGRVTMLPIPPLAAAAAGTGFVTHQKDPDGVVRVVPLWMSDGRRLYPQLGLAAACRFLHVPLSSVKIGDDATVLPGAKFPDGSVRDVSIPTMHGRAGDHWAGRRGETLIAWPDAAPWQRLYAPSDPDPKQHLPIALFVELANHRRAIAANERAADIAVLKLAELLPDDVASALDQLSEKLADAGPDSAAWSQRQKLRDAAVADLQQVRSQLAAAPPGSLTANDRKILANIDAAVATCGEAREQVRQTRKVIDDLAIRIDPMIRGSVCLVGYTATGLEADVVPTSLQPKVPGVVIHGAVLNSILTGEFFERVPIALDQAAIIAVGLLATLIAARLAPVTGLIVIVALVAGYDLVAGALAFDWLHTWVAVASPITAAAAAWVGVTVYRLVSEQRQKDRLKRQFKNYVSADLVELILEDPARIVRGEHELTCAFTDFQGFTSIAERLGTDATAKLLNRYLSVATDLVMQHRGTVNKYLGDGIMAFWGAPLASDTHAIDACRTALAMREGLAALAKDPGLAGLPPLIIRVGVSTGAMKIDDFGAPPNRSDYTVIGNAVNFASRLESANKQFGTQLLISQRTEELVRAEVLTRPLGRIVVVGKTEPVEVFELLAERDRATPEQRACAEATAEAIAAYQRQELQQAAQLFAELAQRYGRSPLVELYVENCFVHRKTPRGEFTGSLVLTSK